jgi:hypothetical protein
MNEKMPTVMVRFHDCCIVNRNVNAISRMNSFALAMRSP